MQGGGGYAGGGSAPKAPDDVSAHMLLGMTILAMQNWVKSYGPSDPRKCNGYTLLTDHVKPWIKERDDTQSVNTILSNTVAGAIGTVNVFISHVQAELLSLTLDVILRFVASHAEAAEEFFFWLDYFVLKQLQKDFHPQVVEKVIKFIGKTLMIAHPWEAPQPIQRVWCVFEILQTVRHHAEFIVALPEEEEEKFMECVVGKKGAAAVLTAVSRVDVEKAESYRPEDKTAIKILIEASVGATKCNQEVIAAVKGGFVAIAEAAAERDPENSKLQGKVSVLLNKLITDPEKRLQYSYRAWEMSDTKLKNAKGHMPNTKKGVAKRLGNLANVQNDLGKSKEALESMQRSLKMREELLESDPDMLNVEKDVGLAHNQLAEMYLQLNQLDKAEQSAQKGLKIFEKKKNQPANLAVARDLLGCVFAKQGRGDEARELFESAMKGRAEKFPENHPKIGDSCKHFGAFLAGTGNKDDQKRAKELLERAIQIYTLASDDDEVKEATAHYNALLATLK